MISKINIENKTIKEKKNHVEQNRSIKKKMIEMPQVRRFIIFTQRSVAATLSSFRDQRNGTQMPKAMEKFPVGGEKD